MNDVTNHIEKIIQMLKSFFLLKICLDDRKNDLLWIIPLFASAECVQIEKTRG